MVNKTFNSQFKAFSSTCIISTQHFLGVDLGFLMDWDRRFEQKAHEWACAVAVDCECIGQIKHTSSPNLLETLGMVFCFDHVACPPVELSANGK